MINWKSQIWVNYFVTYTVVGSAPNAPVDEGFSAAGNDNVFWLHIDASSLAKSGRDCRLQFENTARRSIGGRNQELALAIAVEHGEGKAFTFASLRTEGVDGPTDAAGAIID